MHLQSPASNTTYMIAPLMIGTVMLSFIPIENNSIKGAARPPNINTYGDISKSV